MSLFLQRNQRIAFTVSEIFLTMHRKNIFDGHAFFFLNMGIHLHDFHRKQISQASGNRCLPGTHKTNQQNIFVEKFFCLYPFAVFDDPFENM